MSMTKDEMLEKYEVLGFAAYMCVVKRKSDGVKGTLDFADDPINGRQYYNFVEVRIPRHYALDNSIVEW